MATKIDRTFTVVEWLDPADRADGWISEEDVKRLSMPAVVSTYGEIIEENEIFLKIGYNVEDATRGVHWDGVIVKSTIVRRRDYKYPWRKPYTYKEPQCERDNNTTQAPAAT